MNRIFRFVLLLFVCFSLAGCYETFPPIQSGHVTHWQQGKPQGAGHALSAEQVANLSAWLQNHRWGWQSVMATYPPTIMVDVVHVDGTRASANLMQRVLVVHQYQRSLSEAESNALHAMIGEPSGR